MTPEAMAIRNLYKRHRQILHPKYNVNDRWDTCWEKTAEFLATHGLDPDRFIEAQFAQKKPFPEPNQLYNENALKRYAAYKDAVNPEEEASRRIEFELHFLETRSRIGFTLSEILTQPGAPLTPLFRFYASLMMGDQRLAREFEEQAAEFGRTREQLDTMYRQVLLGEADAE